MSGIKEAYTAREIAGLIGKDVRTVQYAAQNENWPSRPRSGRGGGFEYPTVKLPADVRTGTGTFAWKR